MSDTVEIVFTPRMHCKRCGRELILQKAFEAESKVALMYHPQNSIGTTFYGHGPCAFEARQLEVTLPTIHGKVLP